jgi:carnitine 3-dehydrogenase
MAAWWKTLGSPVLTPEVQKKLIDSVHAEVGSRTVEELEAERDEMLLGLIELRTRVESNLADESDNEFVPWDRPAAPTFPTISTPGAGRNAQ